MTFNTKASLALWRRRVAYRSKRLAAAKKSSPPNAARIGKWQTLLNHAVWMVGKRDNQLNSLQQRALRTAKTLVGVMEEGGNNTGPMVNKIIKANDGEIGEPWCGDFVAYCYNQAGSKAVTRSWASVRALGAVGGIKKVKTPVAGDLVRFNFDHVGMYVKEAGTFIETIEGNTGATGAVSDSKTGGDGVYKKRRAKSVVSDYLRVTR
jgi:hypothetical protein